MVFEGMTGSVMVSWAAGVCMVSAYVIAPLEVIFWDLILRLS